MDRPRRNIGAIPALTNRASYRVQQHHADTLGMSLVHANKTLKRLYASKAVSWKGRMFEMVNRPALAAIAGDDVSRHRPRPFI
ncbi:MAG: hypothetical protein ACRECA_01355 [Pseudolabrys sp.]